MVCAEADAAGRLAAEVEGKLAQGGASLDPDQTASLECQVAGAKGRQLRWRAMALGCYGCGAVGREEAGRMVALMVGGRGEV